MSRVTIKDVAKEAGVSITVVSFILNNTPGQTIPEVTRQRVLDAVKLLDYTPDTVARRMRTKKTMILGVVSFWDISNYVFIDILKGVYKAAEENDYTITICNINNMDKEFNYVDFYKRRQIDGIVFISPNEWRQGFDENQHILKIKENNIPAVILHGTTEDSQTNYIDIDHYSTTQMAVLYLAGLGHKKIGYFHADRADNQQIAQNRFNGFVDAMQKNDLVLNDGFMFKTDQVDEMLKKVKAGEGPTAIIANRCNFASVLLKAAIENNIKIPEQLSVIAANEEPYAEQLYPALTSIGIPFEDIGHKGVAVLIDSFDKANKKVKLKLPNQLIERKSCKKL